MGEATGAPKRVRRADRLGLIDHRDGRLVQMPREIDQSDFSLARLRVPPPEYGAGPVIPAFLVEAIVRIS